MAGARVARAENAVRGAHVAQLVEHVLGKDEVTRSIRVVGSIQNLFDPEPIYCSWRRDRNLLSSGDSTGSHYDGSWRPDRRESDYSSTRSAYDLRDGIETSSDGGTDRNPKVILAGKRLQ